MEFKYRKESKNSYIINGEFKFAVNNKEVMIDYKPSPGGGSGADWVVYRYNFTEPGMYTLLWIYTKYLDRNSTEILTSEIEVTIKL